MTRMMRVTMEGAGPMRAMIQGSRMEQKVPSVKVYRTVATPMPFRYTIRMITKQMTLNTFMAMPKSPFTKGSTLLSP